MDLWLFVSLALCRSVCLFMRLYICLACRLVVCMFVKVRLFSSVRFGYIYVSQPSSVPHVPRTVSFSVSLIVFLSMSICVHAWLFVCLILFLFVYPPFRLSLSAWVDYCPFVFVLFISVSTYCL